MATKTNIERQADSKLTECQNAAMNLTHKISELLNLTKNSYYGGAKSNIDSCYKLADDCYKRLSKITFLFT